MIMTEWNKNTVCLTWLLFTKCPYSELLFLWFEVNQNGWSVLFYKRDLLFSSSFEFKLIKAVMIFSSSRLIFSLFDWHAKTLKKKLCSVEWSSFLLCSHHLNWPWHKHWSNTLWHQNLWSKKTILNNFWKGDTLTNSNNSVLIPDNHKSSTSIYEDKQNLKNIDCRQLFPFANLSWFVLFTVF